MARTFSAKEAKALMQKHLEIKKKAAETVPLQQTYRHRILKASDHLINAEIIRLLRQIPVEEVNRDKKGIRVKALRNAGYHNIADVYVASAAQLASVYGISENTAYTIKHCAAQIAEATRSSVHLHLSSDNQTSEATALLSEIYRYKKIAPSAAQCKDVLEKDNGSVDRALKELEPGTKNLRWLFASAKKKQAATNAYMLLTAKLDNEYGRGLESAFSMMDHIHLPTKDEIWKDFSEDSIRYFQILEDINPGIFDFENATGGLPEDLAREIQEEDFFPDGLLVELRRYQEWGVKYILHQGKVLLGDEMGLGKTVQAIAAMVSLRNTGATHFMVVCPASVLINWCREIREKSRLSVTKIHGNGRSAALRSWIRTGGVAVTTYETTGSLKLDQEFSFSLLIVDEAHYIKNPKTQRTMNVTATGKHAERLLYMTGTALENKVDEMITLISFLQPAIASQVNGMKFLSSAPQFREKVAPVYYRRKREDVLQELPELIEMKEWCSLHAEEEQVYERAVLSKNYNEARRVSWNVDVSVSSKAQRLKEIVDEAKNEDRKIIVFSFFLDTISQVCKLMENQCIGPVNGSVSPQHRQELIDQFDKSPAGTVLAAQIQAGGTGLNIQSASVAIICEPQFKPSIENQAISRAYRMGQTRNVIVHRLLCENTIDEKITNLLAEKQKIFDAFADQSVAAQENIAMDDTTFKDIIEKEIERINKKNAASFKI